MRHLAIALATGAALSLGVSQVAVAAGLPVKARPYTPPPVVVPYSWTGCYIGAHVGGGWARQDASTDAGIAAGLNQAQAAVDLDSSGFIGGGQIGCNYQFGGLVVGVEGDWTWTDLGADASFPNLFANGLPVGSGIVTFSRDTDWLASIRGRLGFAFASNMGLAYVTGGVAFADLKYTGFDAFIGGCPNCGTASSSGTDTGYALGAGLEWAFTPHWIARAEYLYYHFDGESLTAFFQSAPAVTAARFNFDDLHIHTARVGLSFKFGP